MQTDSIVLLLQSPDIFPTIPAEVVTTSIQDSSLDDESKPIWNDLPQSSHAALSGRMHSLPKKDDFAERRPIIAQI